MVEKENKMQPEKLYTITSSPHKQKKNSIPMIMWTVALCLLPACGVGIYAHGWKALWVTLISVVTAVVTECLCQKIRGIKITVRDGSAVVTGLLFAYVISCENYWYVVVVGSAFSIAVAKHAFGGLGLNIWNPALAGRAFVLASYGLIMTAVWPVSEHIVTVSGKALQATTTGATPLRSIRKAVKQSRDWARSKNMKKGAEILGKTPQETWQKIKEKRTTSYLDLSVGTVSGCIGETSALVLLLGGIILLWRGIIKWYLPFSILASTALFAWIFPVHVGWLNGGSSGIGWVWFSGDPLFHILSGGCMIGAIYMATDMVTSPMTAKGQIIFGIGIGFLTMMIRLYGGYPEGVSYSILILNTAVPLIDRYTKPKVFGARN